jgi:CRISPR-associated protein Cas1
MANGDTHMPLEIPELVPARMLNEFVYCPRLFYLEWVQGQFADNPDTIEGRWVHRRVDQPSGDLGDVPASGDLERDQPERGDEGLDERIHARSLLISSERLGLIARIDVLEGAGTTVTPVDYKRGATPDVPGSAWEPDRVQVCAQALILRDNGYTCTEAVIYYAQSKQRVTIPITEQLVTETLQYLDQCRKLAASADIPPPLLDSPKCPRCSLVGICLPDEVTALAAKTSHEETRRLFPARDDGLPVYVQHQGATIGKSGDVLQIRDRHGLLQEVRLIECSQLSLYGNVQITAQALRELLAREIPVCHFSYGGWFYGLTYPFGHRHVMLRIQQYQAAGSMPQRLALARQFVRTKILNARTLLRRNLADAPERTLEQLRRYALKAARAESLDSLLGIEGSAARAYFSLFGRLLRPKGRSSSEEFTFDFTSRNRRPPKDPVNALLSYAYSLLAKDVVVVLLSVGFDPYLGYFHEPRYGRPALALDLMEEFRPIIADSIVLSVINQGEVDIHDFVRRGGGVALTPAGRKRFLAAYERRLDTLITHPVFGYRISYRRVLEVQARLLGRYLAGEIPEYPGFRVR